MVGVKPSGVSSCGHESMSHIFWCFHYLLNLLIVTDKRYWTIVTMPFQEKQLHKTMSLHTFTTDTSSATACSLLAGDLDPRPSCGLYVLSQRMINLHYPFVRTATMLHEVSQMPGLVDGAHPALAFVIDQLTRSNT
jgi:hypothetical protein